MSSSPRLRELAADAAVVEPSTRDSSVLVEESVPAGAPDVPPPDPPPDEPPATPPPSPGSSSSPPSPWPPFSPAPGTVDEELKPFSVRSADTPLDAFASSTWSVPLAPDPPPRGLRGDASRRALSSGISYWRPAGLAASGSFAVGSCAAAGVASRAAAVTPIARVFLLRAISAQCTHLRGG